MSMEFLRDRSGSMIGKIVKSGSLYILYDVSGNRLGYYDTRMNATFDTSGNKIGSGNLLTMLLNR